MKSARVRMSRMGPGSLIGVLGNAKLESKMFVMFSLGAWIWLNLYQLLSLLLRTFGRAEHQAFKLASLNCPW